MNIEPPIRLEPMILIAVYVLPLGILFYFEAKKKGSWKGILKVNFKRIFLKLGFLCVALLIMFMAFKYVLLPRWGLDDFKSFEWLVNEEVGI